MFFGMLLMLFLMTAGGGALVWLSWRRLADHFRENPEAVLALANHLFVPLMGKKKPPEEPQKGSESSNPETAMKTVAHLLPGFFHALAKIVASAVLEAAILLALGYFVLTSTAVKAEIKAQAKQAVKDEIGRWLFSSSQQSNP